MSLGIFNNFLSNDKTDNVEQIGDNLYIFNLSLFNGTSRVKLKFSAIKEMNIVDDLRYFYVYGTFTIDYKNDILEAFESMGDGAGYNSSISNAYQFRGDGRDILEIDIMPQLEEQNCLEVYASESERQKFNIKHKCAIYKYEDITAGKGNKSRKFYFWDIDYQYMSEINLAYSSGEKVKSKKATQSYSSGEKIERSKSNSDSEEYTGTIIEDILKTSLVDIANSTFEKGEWDTGSSKFFYSSPSKNSAIKDIEYVLSIHSSDASNNYMPALLKKQRYTDKYELKPLNLYFKPNSVFGGLFGGFNNTDAEKFYIGKLDPSSIGSLGRSVGPEASLNMSDYNLIEDYTFTRVDAKDVQNGLTNQVVYNYDPRGFFAADVKENNYSSSKKLLENNFSTGGVNTIPENKIRSNNDNVKHNFIAYSMDSNQRKNQGANKGMVNLFFKNSSISFRVRGNTIRKTGQFFSINRRDSNISNTYDNTVLGDYLTTYVRHEFANGSYTTLVHGVKSFSEKNPNFAVVS